MQRLHDRDTRTPGLYCQLRSAAPKDLAPLRMTEVVRSCAHCARSDPAVSASYRVIRVSYKQGGMDYGCHAWRLARKGAPHDIRGFAKQRTVRGGWECRNWVHAPTSAHW